MAGLEKILAAILLVSVLLLIRHDIIHPTSAVNGSWIQLGTDIAWDALMRNVATEEESLDAGEIWKGDYTYTHESDNRREYLRETEEDGGYRLSWVYTFDLAILTSGEMHFYIEARTTENEKIENMSAWWSTSKEGAWRFLGNITSAPERLYGPWNITVNDAQTIYIKINDTVEYDKKRSGILIDHMYIACVMKGADIEGVYFFNNGTHAFFNITLSGQPDPSSFTYVVYLDKPRHRRYKADFRLIYTSDGAELQIWDREEGWVEKEDTITVTDSTSPNSLCFNVSLNSIANPDVQENTELWFETYYGGDNYTTVLDRAPDKREYFISSEVIPELPWPTPLVFIPAVALSIYILYRRRFKSHG
ncbi:MAG: hypothetical protein ACE5NN_05105 [Candidatus Bathyarchaeia archaeon]